MTGIIGMVSVCTIKASYFVTTTALFSTNYYEGTFTSLIYLTSFHLNWTELDRVCCPVSWV